MFLRSLPLSLFLPTFLFVSCSSTQVELGAASVRILQQAPKGCKYLGEATGNQGNFFTGVFTSNENLETGARADLKNKVHHMGGNVAILLTSRAGQTGGPNGGGQQTNVTDSAAVYNCPDSVLENL